MSGQKRMATWDLSNPKHLQNILVINSAPHGRNLKNYTESLTLL